MDYPNELMTKEKYPGMSTVERVMWNIYNNQPHETFVTHQQMYEILGELLIDEGTRYRLATDIIRVTTFMTPAYIEKCLKQIVRVFNKSFHPKYGKPKRKIVGLSKE